MLHRGHFWTRRGRLTHLGQPPQSFTLKSILCLLSRILARRPGSPNQSFVIWRAARRVESGGSGVKRSVLLPDGCNSEFNLTLGSADDSTPIACTGRTSLSAEVPRPPTSSPLPTPPSHRPTLPFAKPSSMRRPFAPRRLSIVWRRFKCSGTLVFCSLTDLR